jgi:Raf kinase inhibitor-like YbhB/YbcL family protein
MILVLSLANPCTSRKTKLKPLTCYVEDDTRKHRMSHSLCTPCHITIEGEKKSMKLTSPAFEHNQIIPAAYTCDGANHHPPLTFSQVPEETQSLALIVEDPDAPRKVFTHWLLYDLPPSTQHIPEDNIPLQGADGINDFGTRGYRGPCPPSGTHHYVFQLFALDTKLGLPPGALKEDVLAKMKGHILARAELVGTYRRK